MKVKVKKPFNKNPFPYAISFTRITQDKQNVYHHIGVYIYKVKVLKKFVKLKQSKNEIKNKLEQMRAVDNGIKINVALANKPSIGVDTMEDFVALKKIMEYKP